MADDVKTLLLEMGKTHEEFKKMVERGEKEIAKFGDERPETKSALQKLNERLDGIEVKLNRPASAGEVAAPVSSKARKEAFNAWLRKGRAGVKPEHAKEVKDMILGDDTTGGFIATSEMVNEVLKEVVEYSPIRSIASVRTTSAKSIKFPRRTRAASASWVGEQGTRSETTNTLFGMEEISNYELSARADVSFADLEDADFDLEAFLRAEFAEQFGVAEGTAFVNGSGAIQPEGLFTNADVSYTVTGSASAIAADGLIALFYAVKDAYARNASWLMRRATIASVRKLKDVTSGQYLWQPGLNGPSQATILGRPVVEAIDVPAEGSNLYPVMFGDFKRAYLIVDRMAMEITRDPYTLSESGLVKFVARRRVGGQVVMAEAVRKNKCST